MRIRKLKWKITVAYSVLIFVTMTALGVRLLMAMESYYEEELKEGLKGHAYLVKMVLEEELTRGKPVEALPDISEQLAKRIHARIELFGPQRQLLSRSVDEGSYAQLKRLRSGVGCAVCHLEVRQMSASFSVPVSIQKNGKTVVTAKVSTSLAGVKRVGSKVRRMVILTLVVTLLLAILIGSILADSIAKPIVEMSKVSQRIAEGHLDQRAKVSSKDEVGLLAENFNRMVSRLESMVLRLSEEAKRRRDFVSVVSHQLRTPVTAILTTTEALLSGGKDDPEVAGEFLDSLAQQSERLSKLLDDLLSMSKAEVSKFEPSQVKVSLRDCVNRVVKEMTPIAERKNIRISVRVPDWLTVAADPQHLEQVLANLIDNAIKYSPKGGSVTISAQEVEQWVSVSVKDTGMGIDERDLPHIFDRFYRGEQARELEPKGTGLGLSIVKEIIEAYGGKVSVDSQPGKGSRFVVHLPKGDRMPDTQPMPSEPAP